MVVEMEAPMRSEPDNYHPRGGMVVTLTATDHPHSDRVCYPHGNKREESKLMGNDGGDNSGGGDGGVDEVGAG